MASFLAEGWESRTKQKLVLAGGLAAALSLRSSPLRIGSKLREFGHKCIGYSGAALLFSGVSETCRAARGRHDFLNTALSGAVTGGVLVGHYQGPKYRLLGVLTWGSVCAVLHMLNSLLQPRHLLEDYLIREGLLSPEVAVRRESAYRSGALTESDSIFWQLENRTRQDVLTESLAVREREMKQLNQQLSEEAKKGTRGAATASSAAAATSSRPSYDDELADDDPGYQAWLRIAGLDSDALLQQPAAAAAEGTAEATAEAGAGGTASASSRGAGTGGAEGQQRREDGARGSGGGGGAVEEGAATPKTAKRRTWGAWLSSPWQGRSQSGSSGGGGSPDNSRSEER